MKNIDSYKATQTGIYLVLFSALGFMISGFVFAFYTSRKHEFNLGLSTLLFISVSLIIYIPFWSYFLFKWKKWAFKKVNDINILIKLSESKNLIYPENHFYSKYEICSKAEKIKLLKLKEKRLLENSDLNTYNHYRSRNVTLKRKTGIIFNQKPLLKFDISGIKFNNLKKKPWSDFSYINLTFDKTLKGSSSFRGAWIDYKLKKDKTKYKYNLTSINNLNIDYFRLEYLFEIYKKLNN